MVAIVDGCTINADTLPLSHPGTISFGPTLIILGECMGRVGRASTVDLSGFLREQGDYQSVPPILNHVFRGSKNTSVPGLFSQTTLVWEKFENVILFFIKAKNTGAPESFRDINDEKGQKDKTKSPKPF